MREIVTNLGRDFFTSGHDQLFPTLARPSKRPWRPKCPQKPKWPKRPKGPKRPKWPKRPIWPKTTKSAPKACLPFKRARPEINCSHPPRKNPAFDLLRPRWQPRERSELRTGVWWLSSGSCPGANSINLHGSVTFLSFLIASPNLVNREGVICQLEKNSWISPPPSYLLCPQPSLLPTFLCIVN